MGIAKLDHYAIRTAKLEETRRFYVEAIGLNEGTRPPFDFPGAWLYQDGVAIVHLVGVDPNDKSGLLDYLGEREGAVSGMGTIDHIAFLATDLDGMRARFKSKQVPYRERTVPNQSVHQVFVEDPNGIVIELNYPFAEKAGAP
jgi:catechol 2,3-dioxygenase-like lactoylglutathione lyase family enzyme